MVMKCLSNNKNNKAFKVPKILGSVSISHIYGKRKAYVFPNQIQRRNYKLGHQFQISISMKTIYALMLTLSTSNWTSTTTQHIPTKLKSRNKLTHPSQDQYPLQHQNNRWFNWTGNKYKTNTLLFIVITKFLVSAKTHVTNGK